MYRLNRRRQCWAVAECEERRCCSWSEDVFECLESSPEQTLLREEIHYLGNKSGPWLCCINKHSSISKSPNFLGKFLLSVRTWGYQILITDLNLYPNKNGKWKRYFSNCQTIKSPGDVKTFLPIFDFDKAGDYHPPHPAPL